MHITDKQRILIGWAGAIGLGGGGAGLRSGVSGWRDTIMSFLEALRDNPIVAFVMLISICLLGYALWPHLKGLLGVHTPRWASDDDLKRTVEGWLLQQTGLSVENAPHDAKASWALAVRTNPTTGFSIAKPAQSAELHFGTVIQFSDDTKKELGSDPSSYNDLQEELAIELARWGVEFSLTIGAQTTEKIPLGFAFVLTDDFDKPALYALVDRIKRVLMVTLVIIKRHARSAVQRSMLPVVSVLPAIVEVSSPPMLASSTEGPPLTGGE